tara:strand:- start:12675 stop:13856 length:1182 start_codon:yes stop_codon:yes gene_type:complete
MPDRNRLLSLTACLILTLGASNALNAATFTVTNLDMSGPGSLRQAVDDANASAGADDIVFAPGLTGTITPGSELVLSESVSVRGPGARLLAISGGNSSRIFRLDNAAAKTVTIADITLQSGSATGNGGAILNSGGNLLLQRVRIVGNTATGDGGGIYNAFFPAGNALTIEDSEISGNRADKQGALYFTGFILRITNSTISGNTALDSVGAIGLQFATAEIFNSSIVGNTATFVGGMQVQASQLTLESTLLADNTDITGINDINRMGSGTTSATASLFSEDVNATSVLNGTNTGNRIGVAAGIGALADNGGPTDSHRLLAGSPAIGAGSNSQALAFDQRGSGFPRDAGGATDIGAVERSNAPQPAPLAVPAMPLPALLTLVLLLGLLGMWRQRD